VGEHLHEDTRKEGERSEVRREEGRVRMIEGGG
jgi:hypothetical protein